ncbi:MAG: GNAT family N-acetyltransferase, partial [Treponema sp.]|nr:GNAT family N-acetyltransferase [Treponema sp.]
MIEIRKLTRDDLPQQERMHTVVYNQRKDYSEGGEKEKDSDADSTEDPPHWSWGAFEKGKLLAGMIENDFLMRFDGSSVKMSGIGGVGTLPEARRGGLIRQIYDKLLPEAFEKGVIFSNLTPFSHDFYRMFGYEIACARYELTIPTRNFQKLKPSGEYVQIFPGDDTAGLQEVHSAYISDINHGICRDYWPNNRAWKNFTEDDPYSTGVFLYLWKDDTGKPRGYIKYEDIEDDEHAMSVKELAFADREGLYGALGLVSGLSSQYAEFRWAMPTFLDPFDFLGEAWDIEPLIKPRDMSRVINIAAALEKMRRPAGEGEYIVKTEDANIPANSGAYMVEYGPEGSRVSFTQKAPHLRCDICTLSQLIT